MIKIFLTYIFLSLFSFNSNWLYSQNISQNGDNNYSLESGLPIIQNYSSKEYNAHSQNWAIIQDKRGIMYFGNGKGLLEYDGVSWRLISIPNEVVRSLAMGEDGIIYVGGTSEFGYLSPDSVGNMQYISLIKFVPEKEREFGNVWTTNVSSQGIFFQTFSHLFLWVPENHKLEKTLVSVPRKGTIKIWKPDLSFHTSFVVYNKLYILERKLGLMTLDKDSLQLLKGGESFANDRLYAMLPYHNKEANVENKQILIGLGKQGLFLYDGISFKPFKTEADDFLRENLIYLKGSVINDSTYAIGTLKGGLVIIDRNGRLQRIIEKHSGLRNQTIHFVYPDREGGVWLALQEGIARVNLHIPILLFGEKSGIEGTVNSICRYNNTLYVGGLYYLSSKKRNNKLSNFRRIKNFNDEVNAFLSTGSNLLVAATEGVYWIDNNQAFLIKSGWLQARSFYRSKKDTNLIYVGLLKGLAKLRLVNNRWIDGGIISNLPINAESIIEEEQGILWVGTNDGIFHIQISSDSVRIKQYSKANGVPADLVKVCDINNKILFATTKGLRRFDTNSNIFLPDSTFGEIFADTTLEIDNIMEDRYGRIWILSKHHNKFETYLIKLGEDGTYSWSKISPLQTVRNAEFNDIAVFHDTTEGDIMWFGCFESNLIRYDISQQILSGAKFNSKTLIREVLINGDSTIFGGTSLSFFSTNIRDDREFALTYNNNNLRFKFSLPSFDNVTANRYQYYLEGFEKNWSAWKSEPQKEYMNLPADNYIFHVRAKNVYGYISNEDTFLFTILPTWYQTWWAYLIYILIVTLSFIAIIKSRVRYLEKKTEELETIIAKRTAQVVEQKNKLEVQAEKLKTLDHLKSRFFANISHEFRTPLTLILGQIESLQTTITKVREKSKLQMVSRNARRLQRLINQLLDISKLESGKMKLRTGRGNIISFLKKVVATFESFAEQKEIILEFNSEYDELELYYDQEKLENIFENLLSNAFKFTPEGGVVTLIVKSNNNFSRTMLQAQATDFVEIIVKDTGIGISADRLPYIFDRFYQVDDSHTREHEGSGIGLAFVKELVELHKGKISVVSEEGVGTEFTIKLPLGSKHLLENQISDIPHSSNLEKEITDYVHGIEIDEELSFDKQQIIGTEKQELPIRDEIILIVEDNPDLREYIGEHLKKDYKLLEASDGEMGMNKALETIPDLIVTDLMMPKMDGYQLCSILKNNEKTSHIPIIMLTAKATEEDKIEGLKIGVDDYLIKPFSPKELLVRVKNLIQLRRQLRERFSRATVIKPSEVTAISMDQEFLKRVIDIIDSHISDEQFGVDKLAEDAAISITHLNRKLKALIDQPAGKLIRSMRLQRAADLLKQNVATITEIALEIGFSDHASFTRSFKKQFGCSPKKYIKHQQ